MCHGTLVDKKGTGFWEGGKGTRDKVKMSRKGMLWHSSFLFLSFQL